MACTRKILRRDPTGLLEVAKKIDQTMQGEEVHVKLFDGEDMRGLRFFDQIFVNLHP
jgi:hypothetical protein